MIVDEVTADDPPAYRIIDLGTPAVEGFTVEQVIPHGMNNIGEVVGDLLVEPEFGGIPSRFTFFWLPEPNYGFAAGMHLLVGDVLPDDTDFSQAKDINNNGFIAGGVTLEDGLSFTHQARVWELFDGSIIEHTLSFPGNDVQFSQAEGINDQVGTSAVVTGSFRVEIDPVDGSCECTSPVRYGFATEVASALPATVLLGQDQCDDGPPGGEIPHGTTDGFDVNNNLSVVGRTGNCFIGPCGTQCGDGAKWTFSFDPATGMTELLGINELPTEEGGTTVARAINDANDAVGWSIPVGETATRAAYWDLIGGGSAVELPILGLIQDEYQALDIAEPFGNEQERRVVGANVSEDGALLWQSTLPSDPLSWTVINLETEIAVACGWDALFGAEAINDNGWITGQGSNEEGNDRGYLLAPRDQCLADIVDDSCECPDGVVNVSDLLTLLANWGTDGPGAAIAEPLDVVDVSDLLEMLSQWGACANQPPPNPGASTKSLQEEVEDAGLIWPDDWDEFEDVMINGTQAEKDNYRCWMERYLSQCVHCKSCPDRDPFAE